jgi:hypothetical protein
VNPLELALLYLIYVQQLLKLDSIQDNFAAADRPIYPESVLLLNIGDAPLELMLDSLKLFFYRLLHKIDVSFESLKRML